MHKLKELKIVANKQGLKAAADDLEQKIKLVVAETQEDSETNAGEEAESEKQDGGESQALDDNENCPASTNAKQKVEKDPTPAVKERESRPLRSSSRLNSAKA